MNIEAGSAFHDILRQTSGTRRLTLRSEEAWFSATMQLGRHSLRVAGDQTRRSFTLSNASESLDLGLMIEHRSLSLAYAVDIAPFQARTLLSVVGYGGTVIPQLGFWCGMDLAGPRLARLQFGISNYVAPSDVQASFHDALVPMRTLVRGQTLESSFALSAASGATFVLDHSYSWSAPSGRSGEFGLLENSHASSWKGSLSHELADWKLNAWFDYRDVNSVADFLLGSTSFGGFASSDWHTRSFGLDLSSLRPPVFHPHISIGHVLMMGGAVGNIQSWPFAGILESIILNRVNMRINGNLRLVYCGFEYGWEGQTISFTPSFFYYHAKPELTIESWRPAFLVFGVSEYSQSRLNIEGAGIVKLAASMSGRFGFGLIQLDVGQLLPLFVTRSQESEASPVPHSSAEPSAATSSEEKTDGGRWIRITIRRGF